MQHFNFNKYSIDENSVTMRKWKKARKYQGLWASLVGGGVYLMICKAHNVIYVLYLQIPFLKCWYLLINAY